MADGNLSNQNALTAANVDAANDLFLVFDNSATGDDKTKKMTPPELQKMPYETIVVALGDESTDLATGTATVTFRMPFAMTLLSGASGVKASVTTAPTGSTATFDINDGGTTILSTKLTIDATEKTSATAATAVVVSDTALAADAEITIDVDAVGSTVAGAGAKIYLIGNRT